MQVRTKRFRARAKDGQVYRLVAETSVTFYGGRGDPVVEDEGMTTIKTEDGRLVNHISKGRYNISETDIELRTNDPDAP